MHEKSHRLLWGFLSTGSVDKPRCLMRKLRRIKGILLCLKIRHKGVLNRA